MPAFASGEHETNTIKPKSSASFSLSPYFSAMLSCRVTMLRGENTELL